MLLFAAPESSISGLTRIDDLVLREIARLQIEENGNVGFDWLRAEPNLAELPESELRESLEILGQKYLIEITPALGVPILYVTLTDHGFQQFAAAHDPEYKELIARIAALLVNEGIRGSEEIANRVKRPIAFVNFVFRIFEGDGHILLSKEMGWDLKICQISPSLKRSLF